MNVLPSMDSKNIERDSNGTIFIKPMPIVAYVEAIIIILFAIGALVRGQIVLGLALMGGGLIFFFLTKNAGTSFEFNTQQRMFSIGGSQKSFSISFDEIAGFSVEAIKERMNFTEEQILVILKNGGGIHLGTITDANQQKRAEKVAKMMSFLSESTSIGTIENGSYQNDIAKQ